jgi:hypothetical protein
MRYGKTTPFLKGKSSNYINAPIVAKPDPDEEHRRRTKRPASETLFLSETRLESFKPESTWFFDRSATGQPKGEKSQGAK